MSIPIERRSSAQRGPKRAHNGLEHRKPIFDSSKKEVKKKVKKVKKVKEKKFKSNEASYPSSGLAMDGSVLMVDFGDGTGMGFDGKLKLTL